MISPFTEFGTQTMQTDAFRPQMRARELHSLTVGWQAPDATLYPLGSRPFATYPRMVITDREVVNQGPVFDYRLRLDGIIGDATYIETSFDESQPDEGWDQISRVLVTEEPTRPEWMKGGRIISPDTGLVLPGFERLWVCDRASRKHEAEGYHEVGLLYKGLRYDKPVKRRINTTAQALSDGNFDAAILIEPVYIGPASNPTAITTSTYMLGGAMEFDLPQISVTDTMISTNAPPTGIVPGNWIPDDAPSVRIISLTGGADIYHLPSGWKILNIVSEQIPNQYLWLISVTWGYQRPNTPRSA